MAWVQWQIEHKGKSSGGWVDQDQLLFDVPYELDIKVGDTFIVNNNSIKAISVENVGGRDETISMTVKKEKNDVYKSDKSRKDT